jgi:hypothetical protein
VAVKPENMPGAGDVVLKLGDDEVILRCNFAAAQRLSRQPGGLIDLDNESADTVYRRIRRHHIDTMAEVIRAGAGLGTNAVPTLPQQIYEFGLLEMNGLLHAYILNLANGGKPIGTVADDEEDGDGKNPPGATAKSD